MRHCRRLAGLRALVSTQKKSAAALALYFTLQKQRLYHRERIGASWMWALAFGHHEDRAPTHGYEATRDAAMTAFAKSWRRE
jgi:hypothetical protein